MSSISAKLSKLKISAPCSIKQSIINSYSLKATPVSIGPISAAT